MKRFIVLALFAAVFASAPMAMAQYTGGIVNAPTSGLPTLTGTETGTFPAKDMTNAQVICDQVASANNKTGCTAIKDEANPTNQVSYHCECR